MIAFKLTFENHWFIVFSSFPGSQGHNEPLLEIHLTFNEREFCFLKGENSHSS